MFEPVLPKIVKGEARPCCSCSGRVTFGMLTYPDWGGRGVPLAWHSTPHCKQYAQVPNTNAGVLALAARCGLSLVSRVEQYVALIEAWMKARDEAPGGELTEKQESDWVGRLDDVYWQMSPEEQSRAEATAHAMASARAAAHEGTARAVVAGEAHDVPPAPLQESQRATASSAR